MTRRAKACNPIKDSQSIVIFSRSDIQHHIRTQELQEVLTKMDTIQRHSIDQNLRKLTETAGFSAIFSQDCSGYFEDIEDLTYPNDEKYRSQDISKNFTVNFVKVKNKLLAYIGWPYYLF